MNTETDNPTLFDLIELQNLQGLNESISQGADVNQTSEDGHTPLQSAAKLGNMEIFDALVDAGANADTPDNKGRTPIYEASKRGNLEIVKKLLSLGADPIRADVKEATPFHMASKKGHQDVVQVLIDAGANTLLSKPNYKGYTPLHEAARKGKTKVAMRYLEMGADPNAPDIHGNRPAILAHAFGYTELAEKLGALSDEELVESQKIQNIEDIKESAKQIVVQHGGQKAEMKVASKAALDFYLENLESGRSHEDLKTEAMALAQDSLPEPESAA